MSGKVAANDAPSVRVNVVLPAALLDELRGVAKARGVGLSTLIRMLLYSCVERSS